MIASIRAEKNKTVKLKTLLSYFNLKSPTYYDELHQLHKPDKYTYVENKMKELARKSKITYGYHQCGEVYMALDITITLN